MKSGETNRCQILDDVGRRIREARVLAGLTQEELAGGDITRNMLSRIENGAALPSLPTLCALADRLGIPAGAFLGDLEEYNSYKLKVELQALLVKKKYQQMIERCKSSGQKLDDELRGLLYEAYVKNALDKYLSGRLGEAQTMLDEAERCSPNDSPDPTQASGKAVLLRMLLDKAACISGVTDGSESHQKQDNLMLLRRMIFGHSSLAIYVYARELLDGVSGKAYSVPDENAGFYRLRLEPLISELPDGFLRSHIEAKLDMVNADYLGAKARLVPYCEEDVKLAPTFAFDLYTDLEFCCKCCGDFENAYKYSNLKLAVLRKIK